jgi:HD-GYP domain-containing protein (c-di-GMP phosphodiesterase class II)
MKQNPKKVTVHHAAPVHDLGSVSKDLVAADARAAGLFLLMTQETAEAGMDEAKLLPIISRYTFKAFPQATHMVLAVTGQDDDDLEVLFARSRFGDTPDVALSTTLADRVIYDGVAMLYTSGPAEEETSDSLVMSRIEAAVCAPLQGTGEIFGLLELDVRGGGNGLFSRQDLDRLTVFAHHVGLVLDNLRLAQEQTRGFESTINALVHSLFLRDPDTAAHSERVQSVSLCLGEASGLNGVEQYALGIAALLHDLGKQGIRHEVLNKPARLTDNERKEMDHHSKMTQTILDKIHYPAHLKDVPIFAAYHHEKLDGTGPYKLPGEKIPLAAKIISIADAFDALISPRVYKPAKPPEEVLRILNKGRGKAWDPVVLDTLEMILPDLLVAVYGQGDDHPQSEAA